MPLARNERSPMRQSALLAGLLVFGLGGCASIDEAAPSASSTAPHSEQPVDVASAAEALPDGAGTECASPDNAFGCYAVPETVVTAGAVVIVRSSGPSAAKFAVGQKLAGDAALTLLKGDILIILDQAGTRELRGPGVFRLAPSVANSRSRYAALSTRSPQRRARTGAVRGDAAPAPSVARMQVVRGDPGALAWYGIGRSLPVDARVCLPANARFITFERLDGGGQITYGGGECNKRVTAPPKGPNEEDGVWRGP